MKFRRLTIALVSLAITLAIAFVYDREFVVILDYDANESASLLSRENDDSSRDVIESQVPELLPLFPNPDDWRRASANVVVPAGRECVFLSKGGPILSPDQKTIALNACTLVFLGSRDPNLSEQEQIDRSLVFESTDKIELTFSDSLANVAHLTSEDSPGIDFSKFVSGRMRGEVVLRTKLGGADVMLKTRDVVFNATQIHTNFARARGSRSTWTRRCDLVRAEKETFSPTRRRPRRKRSRTTRSPKSTKWSTPAISAAGSR